VGRHFAFTRVGGTATGSGGGARGGGGGEGKEGGGRASPTAHRNNSHRGELRSGASANGRNVNTLDLGNYHLDANVGKSGRRLAKAKSSSPARQQAAVTIVNNTFGDSIRPGRIRASRNRSRILVPVGTTKDKPALDVEDHRQLMSMQRIRGRLSRSKRRSRSHPRDAQGKRYFGSKPVQRRRSTGQYSCLPIQAIRYAG